jgi:hypothetical protein
MLQNLRALQVNKDKRRFPGSVREKADPVTTDSPSSITSAPHP